MSVPDGYAAHFRRSPVTDPWEPLYSKRVGGAVVLAIRVREPHCNARGFLHGGVISALADNAMGLSVLETLKAEGADHGRHASTVSLALDFLATAHLDQWLEIVPRVLKVGGSLAFADCVVLADGQRIARGNATFCLYQAPTAGQGGKSDSSH